MSMFDPCPEHLRPHRAASWKISDRITGTLAPVAKSITGSGELSNSNTVQTQHPRDGRTIVGPAAYFDSSVDEYFSSTDTDLLPDGNDYTIAAVVGLDNDSQIDTATSLISIVSMGGAAEFVVFRMGLLQAAADSRMRLGSRVLLTSPSTYLDTLPVGTYVEPLVCVASQDATAGEVKIRYIGLDSGDLYVTHTVSGVLTLSDVDTLRFGYRISGTYVASRPIQDCWTILQNYCATEDDAMAFRDHIWQQREYMSAFLAGRMS